MRNEFRQVERLRGMHLLAQTFKDVYIFNILNSVCMVVLVMQPVAMSIMATC